MKRKWVWGLAALPLVIGLVVAKPLADKRPKLVARGFEASALKFSPNGKLLFAQFAAERFGKGIVLSDKSRFKTPEFNNLATAFFFTKWSAYLRNFQPTRCQCQWNRRSLYP